MKYYKLQKNHKKFNHQLGILYMILACFSFAAIGLIVKLLDNIPLMEIVFFRNLLSMLVVPIILIKNKIPIMGNNKPLLISRGFLGCFGMIFLFYGYSKISITDATAIISLSPFLVIIFSAIFLKEKFKLRQLPLVFFVFLGTLFVIKPGFHTEILPVIAPLIASILMSLSHIIIRQLRFTDNYWVIINYFVYISGFTAMITMLLEWKFILPNFYELILFLLLGFFSIGSQVGITLTYHYAPARVVSSYYYSQIFFVAVFEIIILKGFPDLLTFLGTIIIVIGSILNYRFIENY